MAKSKRPRLITLGDTAATTGRVLNPVGSYASSPSTAVYGQLGKYGSGLPTGGNVGGGLGLNKPNVLNLLTGNYNLANTLPTGAQGIAGVSGSNEPYRGQPSSIQSSTLENAFIGGGGAQKVNPSLVRNPITGSAIGGLDNSLIPNAPSNYSIRSLGTNVQNADSAIRMARQSMLNNPAPNVRTSGRSSFGVTPQAMDDLTARIAYMNPEELNGFMATMPPAQRDAIERTLTQGQNITGVQNIGGQDLYKTDEGIRYDAQGNEVWNPKTATTDIYGGDFVQEGATKWTRLANGKVVRQVAKGGKFQTVKSGGRRQPNQPVQPSQVNSGSTGSYGLVSFNTGTG